MPDIPNTMWDPLIQSGEITLEQEKKEYIAEKGKETESKSNEQERISKVDRYNAKLNSDFGRLQKQNALMQSEFEQRLSEMSIDFKVKIKNHIHEFENLQEATEKRRRQEIQRLIKDTDKKYRD